MFDFGSRIEDNEDLLTSSRDFFLSHRRFKCHGDLNSSKSKINFVSSTSLTSIFISLFFGSFDRESNRFLIQREKLTLRRELDAIYVQINVRVFSSELESFFFQLSFMSTVWKKKWMEFYWRFVVPSFSSKPVFLPKISVSENISWVE